jgi:hypothetical protein
MLFLGKHLLVLLDKPANGSLDAYATVVRPWGDQCANIMVFPDGPSPQWCTSVPVVANLAEAQAKRAAGNSGPIAYHPQVASCHAT